MKRRLVILSDLWGFQKPEWIKYYTELLEPHFNIVLYDSCDLAGIQTNTKEEIHQQFVKFGIEKAVEKIIALEKNEIDILAFSIGGTIAWKFALNNLSIKNLTVVSATRLRFETKTPDCNITLIYGERDNYKPSKKWLKTHNNVTIIQNASHELYLNADNAQQICSEVVRNL